MIQKNSNGGYNLYSKDSHKNLGYSSSKEGIEHREKQVEYFKNLHKYLKYHGHPFPSTKIG